ncbi:hypothetical protein K474DRAFT_1648846 [Panus rudis PR-1116 ss-1]|nr:hypothetical protein K474DRAFT_1648846 [Panus rudis PR-1116 ss-1]
MSDQVLINSAHQSGLTCLTFARDGSRIYTGGSDSLVRIWNAKAGADQEPDVAIEAVEGITSVSAGDDFWLSGSVDSEVRKYEKGSKTFTELITSAIGVAIRCVAVDPKSKRVAVTSDETFVKLVNLENTIEVRILRGHTKAVRSAAWHPSGSLLTTCGGDGKIIVWDVSEEEPKIIETIDGIIPAVSDTESPEYNHDCAIVWHPSGQYFIVATRAHEIISISRSNWTKTSTFSDPSSSGVITALALSSNGVYLASSTPSGIAIWSTQTRKLLFKFQGSITSPVVRMAFSPSDNLLAWTDLEGVLTRWKDPIPSSSPDPVKVVSAGSTVGVQVKRKPTPPRLFDDDVDEVVSGKDKDGDTKLDGLEDEDLDDGMLDIADENWIVDDIGDGLADDETAKKWEGGSGIREMVSVTKAQPPFQPGSTPMENKKRYLAYNTIGVIEVTDQDTHHIVNVEFHDRSARKSYHFTDHFKYDIAALGERGALYACPPEASHPAHVLYKPYGTYAAQSEWQYEFPLGTRVLGLAAGGPPITKSRQKGRNDIDIGGNGNVVIATSDGELIFLTGGGVERNVLSLPGEFVTMCAGREWVFVVTRDGSTTMDGSQNLTGRLIKFDNFCLLQKEALPVPKNHTLKWVGVSDEGAPVIYDSSGVLHALPRFRIPFAATWVRVLNTNTLERREGKHESYWPVGVSGETFMCLILKGRQEHPGFPRPLIQELAIKLPFKRNDPKESPLEEGFARENMLLDILRDGLDEETLTTDDISRRELQLDKSIIQLIQFACKADKLARAIDLAKMLNHTASFDIAIKVANFYHLIGLQEKFEALKDEREERPDRLAEARERRRERAREFDPVPDKKLPIYTYNDAPRPKAFSDFRPPPPIPRPGLERAIPAIKVGTRWDGRRSEESSQVTVEEQVPSSTGVDDDMYAREGSPAGKRKREESIPREAAEAKRRAVDESISALPPRSNPFARKPGQENNRNPFTKPSDTNKSLHKSESFFSKVDAAESEKTKRPTPAKGKAKDKNPAGGVLGSGGGGGRQTTLFGLPPPPPEKKEKTTGKKKKANTNANTTSNGKNASELENETQVTLVETQETDVVMDVDDESQPQPHSQPQSQSQDKRQVDTENLREGHGTPDATPNPNPTQAVSESGSPEPIEWPESPRAETNASAVDVVA